ncbi:MAG: hypothetical protein H7251_15475 [Acetobacteraceae bacterium]|nr:hypothetical protein [Acetobacteraceae bacterium]
MENTAWLVLFSLSLAVGQMMFKQAAKGIAGAPVADILPLLGANIWVWMALVLYGLSTVLWVWILSWMPLSRAYPWTALGAVVVPLAATLLFAETVTPVFWLGAVLIGIGVVLTQFGSS